VEQTLETQPHIHKQTRDSLGAIHRLSQRQVFFANSSSASETFCAVTKVSITWQKSLCGRKGQCQLCFVSFFF